MLSYQRKYAIRARLRSDGFLASERALFEAEDIEYLQHLWRRFYREARDG